MLTPQVHAAASQELNLGAQPGPAFDLPLGFLRMLLPHVQLAPGCLPHSVCRSWRNALASDHVTLAWILHGRSGGDLQKAARAVGRYNRPDAFAMAMEFLATHVRPLERTEQELAQYRLRRPWLTDYDVEMERKHEEEWAQGIAEECLTAAAGAGSKIVCQLILLTENPLVQKRGSWDYARGLRALCAAACEGHHDIIQLLLANGARADGIALRVAAREGQAQVLQVLLSFLHSEAPANFNRETLVCCLNEAAARGHMAVAQVLVGWGAKASKGFLHGRFEQ